MGICLREPARALTRSAVEAIYPRRGAHLLQDSDIKGGLTQIKWVVWFLKTRSGTSTRTDTASPPIGDGSAHTGNETKNKTEGGSGPHTCEKGAAARTLTAQATHTALSLTRSLPRQS
jgi:hypothetical protein